MAGSSASGVALLVSTEPERSKKAISHLLSAVEPGLALQIEGPELPIRAALGTQYTLIDQYSSYLNYAVYAAFAGVVVWLVIRCLRRKWESV